MTTAAVIFALTYLVIAVQGVPRLRLDRASGALLGAVAMVAFGALPLDRALAAIDLDTILFLLGMMIVLAYLELSGFFQVVERRVMGAARSARGLLLLVVFSAGVLSALFMNDTVCIMLTPVVLRVAKRLGLPPVPYVIALVTAANIGSVATIVGNPQNAMIAVRSGIGLLPFTAALWPVAALGLLIDALLLCWVYRREVTSDVLVVPPPREPLSVERWMLTAGIVSGAGMLVALGFGARPAAAAMSAAAVVILAGAARPREVLREVDWVLLLFFAGLFVVMRGVADAGLASKIVEGVAGPIGAGGGVVLARLTVAVTLLSQAVSNVPAVMLFAPGMEVARAGETLWLALAASATLAGNLTILGSVANVIVVETARREGVEVSFLEYLRVGGVVTVLTLVVAWGVLVVRG